MSRAPVLLAARNVRKAFSIGDRRIEVLHGVHLELRKGELLGLVGASGAGKSTLLHVLGLLDPPTEGQVLLDGQDAWKLTTLERARLRNTQIGFVFQFYHLLPELDAVENVVLPALIGRRGLAWRGALKELRPQAEETLVRFGLGQRLKHRPAQLSGGEQQRVAIARAMFLDPALVIADEPTGNLDSATGEKVLEILVREQRERGLALLLVTHDERVAKRCDRVVLMEDGQIQADSSLPIPE
jgi:lipoprotein-releasing system ATP-binding protein